MGGGGGGLAAGNYLPLAQRPMVGRTGDLPLLCTKGEALGDLRGSALLLLTKVPGIMVGQGLRTQAVEEVDRWGLVHVACLAPFTQLTPDIQQCRVPWAQATFRGEVFLSSLTRGQSQNSHPCGTASSERGPHSRSSLHFRNWPSLHGPSGSPAPRQLRLCFGQCGVVMTLGFFYGPPRRVNWPQSQDQGRR